MDWVLHRRCRWRERKPLERCSYLSPAVEPDFDSASKAAQGSEGFPGIQKKASMKDQGWRWKIECTSSFRSSGVDRNLPIL